MNTLQATSVTGNLIELNLNLQFYFKRYSKFYALHDKEYSHPQVFPDFASAKAAARYLLRKEIKHQVKIKKFLKEELPRNRDEYKQWRERVKKSYFAIYEFKKDEKRKIIRTEISF